MATDTLTLKFKGIDEVTPATNKINAGLADFGKTAGNVAKGALAAVAVGAAAVAAELYVAAKAAIEAEENMARLQKALQNSGQATKANLDALTDQASALQATTKYSDDAVMSLQALAVNLGASTDEALLITKASTDMAAALGVDAEGAARALSLSLSGNTTALGKLIPEVKTMTKEQLAHGDAIALVAKKYKGFAENEGATLGGTLTRLSNAFGDIQEEIGAMFTQNEGLTSTLSGLIPVMEQVKSLVMDNKDGLRDMVVYGVKLAIDGFGLLAKGGVVLTDTLFAIMEGYKRAAIALDEFNQKITPWETSGISERIAEAKTELASIVQMRSEFAKTGTEIFRISDAASELATQAGAANYQMKAQADVVDNASSRVKTYAERVAMAATNNEKAAAAVWDYTDAMNEQAQMMDFLNSQSLQNIGAQAQQGAGGSFGGIASGAAGGNVGATAGAAVTEAFKAMMPVMGQYFGEAAGTALNLIIGGSKEKMDQFFLGIAESISNLASYTDDFIVSLAENWDKIQTAIYEMPTKLATELAAALPGMLVNSVTGVFDSVKGVFTGLVDTFRGIGDGVLDALGIEKEQGRGMTADEARALVRYLYESGAISKAEAGRRLQQIQNTYTAEKEAEGYYDFSAGVSGRAFGGPVTAGQPYIVGDGQDGSMRNAELFIPSKSGTIVPKGGEGGANISVNITADQNPRVTAQYVTAAVKFLIDSKQWRFDPIRNMAVA